MPKLLEVGDVHAGYGDHAVLHGLSFDVEEGENVGLFGPNGHGKTTLFEVISGLVKPDRGRVRFGGEDITGLPPPAIVERGLIHVAQGNTLFSAMRVDEVLRLGAFPRRAHASATRNRDMVLALFPRLGERLHQRCGTLSGGERQMLNLAVGLMADPRLLILDEPTLGLSPRLKDELASSIERIAAQGVPLVVVEQDVGFLLRLSARLFLISHGRVARTVRREEEGLEEDAIMREYFGVSGS